MKLSTKVIHGVESEKNPGNSVVTPVHQTSIFYLGDKEYQNITAGRPEDVMLYTRYNNPTIEMLEGKIASLEGADRALVFSSGLGAIAATITAFAGAGDSVVTSLDIYGGTLGLFQKELARMGIEFIFVDPEKIESIPDAIKPNTKLVFLEALSNPLLKVLDLPSLVKSLRDRDILIVIDNTFLSPINFRPLEYGADLVVHSASKYLNGHSDVIAGTVAGRKDLVEQIWRTRVSLGTCIDPFAAFLMDRGVKTLAVRIAQHNKNAQEVAEYLDDHPKISKVRYSGLPSYEGHKLAQRLFDGFGGMVTFVIEKGDEAGIRFIRHLSFPAEATSLGGVESLISMPFNTSHAGLTPEQRSSMGILPGTVRLSVGIEDAGDLISDIDQALDRI